MTTWTLILTIVLAPNNIANGAAVHSVPGFESYQACINAGEKWGRGVLKGKPAGLQMTAACVPLAVVPEPKRAP